LAKDKEICGVPAVRMRDFFRGLWLNNEFTSKYVRSELGSRVSLRRLVREGYLVSPSRGYYQMTDKGRRVGEMRFGNGIKRSTADRLLNKAIEAVEQLNQQPNCMFVKRMFVFGGYLSDREVIGDLDLAIEIVDFSKVMSKALGAGVLDGMCRVQAIRSELSCPSYLTMLFAPMLCAKRAIKGKSRCMDVVTWEILENLAKEDGAEYKLVYEDPSPQEHVVRYLGSLSDKEIAMVTRGESEGLKKVFAEMCSRARALPEAA
jgi:hypothetical protein